MTDKQKLIDMQQGVIDDLKKSEIPEGFTPWHGGECPVDGDTEVQVFLRHKIKLKYAYPAAWFRWKHKNARDDIIAYRVASEPKNVHCTQNH